MQQFWELFKASVIVQALLALMVTGAIVYALLSGLAIPEQLWAMWGLILGWYFGSKSHTESATAARNVARDLREAIRDSLPPERRV